MNELLTGAGIVFLVWRVAFLVRVRRFRRGRGPAPASRFDLGMQLCFALALLAGAAVIGSIDAEDWDSRNRTMPQWLLVAVLIYGAFHQLTGIRELRAWRRDRGEPSAELQDDAHSGASGGRPSR